MASFVFLAAMSVLGQNTHQSHVEKGDILREKKDLKGAEAEYKEALWFDKKSPAALVGLGLVAHLKGDLKTAITSYRESLAIVPSQAEVRLYLADALMESDAVDQALIEYKQVAPKLNASSQLHNNYGVALLAKGDLKAATAEFREAAALTKAIEADADAGKGLPPCVASAFVPHYNYAAASARAGQTEVAVVEYTKAATGGASREGYVRLGRALRAAGAADGAIINFGRALQVEASCSADTSSLPKRFFIADKAVTQVADIYFALGLTLQERGELPRALAQYQRALSTMSLGTVVAEAVLKQKIQGLRDRLEPKGRGEELPRENEPVLKAPGVAWFAVHIAPYKDVELPNGCRKAFGNSSVLDVSAGTPKCVQKLAANAEFNAALNAAVEANRRLPAASQKRKDKILATLVAANVGADCPTNWVYSAAYTDPKQESLERMCTRVLDKSQVCPEGTFDSLLKTCIRHQCDEGADDLGSVGMNGCLKCQTGTFDSKQTLNWLKKEGGRKPLGLALCRVNVSN